MCTFCEAFEWDEDGECLDRYNYIFDHRYPFGIRSKIVGKLMLVAPDATDLPNKFKLNVELSVDDGDSIILDEYVPINYCPFCGKELKVE